MSNRRFVVLLVLLSLFFLPGILPAEETEGKSADNFQLALQAALTRHPRVKSLEAELKSLGFNLDAEKSRRLPSIGVSAQTMTDEDYYGLVRIQQVLTSFGKIEGAVSLENQRVGVKKAELFLLYRTLIEETAAAYTRLWGAQQRLVVAEENLVGHDDLYQMILRRSKGGIASEADVGLAFSRLLQATAQRDQYAGAVEKARNDLNALTQIPLSADEPVDPELMVISSSNEILQDALANEASLKVRQEEVELVRREAKLARSELNPTLYLRFDQYLGDYSGTSYDSRIGIALEASLDGMGVTGKKRVQAEFARVEAAEGQVEAMRNDIRRRVSSLLADVRTNESVGVTYGLAAAERQATLESFLRQFDAGRKSWLDVLNSQSEVFEMRHMLVQSKINWMEASLRLAALVGQLDRLAGNESK